MFLHPKFTFIHLPKCAGDAVSCFLEEKFPEGEYHRSKTHGTAHRPASKVPDAPRKWGTIRNPWSWYVSFWQFNRGNHKHYGELLEGEKNDNFDTFIQYLLTRGENVKTQGYARHVPLKPDEGLLTTFYRYMFQDDNGNYLVEKIVPVEYLPPFIKRTNDTKHKHYSHYYNKKTMELVAQKDKYIIKKYGYTFARRQKKSKNSC